MEISELTLKLIILLIPGALGTIIMSRLIIRKELTPFKFVLNCIIIGVFSYLMLQLLANFGIWFNNIFATRDFPFMELTVWNSISDSKLIPYKEVIGSCITGVIIGFIASWIDHKKFINRFAQKIKLSSKYGDENLFSYFLNADQTQIVYIRSIKNNLTYHGYVNSYSETDSISEIVLSNVTVYRYEDSEKLYEVDQIYLSFTKTDVIIEHANILNNGEETSSTEPKASK